VNFQFEAREAFDGQAEPYEPHLSFTPDAWRKVVLYTLHCPFEISGLGLVQPRGPDFVVTDVLLIKQRVNDIATVLDRAAVSALMLELLAAGTDPGDLKLWWHSHAEEAPFWSGEDEETIEHFQNDEFMLSLVGNHRLQFLARQDHYRPRRTTWLWIDRPSEPVEASPEELAAIRAEIDATTLVRPRENMSRLF
jgi:hypothetical protein